MMEDFGDNFAEVDPAADFLAREQNELAGLEDDLNPATLNPPAEDGLMNCLDVSSSGNVEINNSLDQSEWICIPNGSSHEITLSELVKEEPATEPQPKETPVPAEVTPAPAVKAVREEPEKIRKWREEQKKRLEEKDANEEKKKEEWRLAAKKELEEWYRHHDDLILKTKATNRNAEKQFVAEINAIQPGTEWERISKLCDFNPKSSKSSKDVSRMRSIILQLKQNPIKK